MTDDVRRASGGFDFTALLGGVRPSASPSIPQQEMEENEAGARPSLASIMEEQTAELRALWQTSQEAAPLPDAAPTPPWARGRENEAVRIAPPLEPELSPRVWSNPDRAETAFLAGALRRLLVCLWTIVIGACLGAGASPYLREQLASPGRAASLPSASAPAVKPKAAAARPAEKRPAVPPKRSTAPEKDLSSSLRARLFWPLLGVSAVALLWVLGAPLLLGASQGVGYQALALAVLLLSGLSGAHAATAVVEAREANRRASAQSRTAPPKPAPAPAKPDRVRRHR